MTTISQENTMWTKQCNVCGRVLPTFPVPQFYSAGGRLKAVCKRCWDHDPARTASDFDFRYRRAHGTDPIPSEMIPWEWLVKTFPTCNVCARGFGSGDLAPSLDHVIPVSDPRSSHTHENVHLVHRVCNARKGTKNLEDAAMRLLSNEAGVRSCEDCGESHTLSSGEFAKLGFSSDGSQRFDVRCRNCRGSR